VAPFDPGTLVDGDLGLELVDFAVHSYHAVPTYYFRMVNLPTAAEAGHINLRAATTPHIERFGGHIGYDVEPEHRGQRFAARSVRLLLPLARKLGLDPLWITCDPDNGASRRTLEIAGAEFVEIVDVPADCAIHKSGHPRKCRYRL
jgi:tagatose 1,6-diphosphate aldolase